MTDKFTNMVKILNVDECVKHGFTNYVITYSFNNDEDDTALLYRETIPSNIKNIEDLIGKRVMITWHENLNGYNIIDNIKTVTKPAWASKIQRRNRGSLVSHLRNRRFRQRALEAGIFDDIKSDLKNSKTIKNLKTNAKEKFENVKNNAINKYNKITGKKDYIYEFRAFAKMTFYFAENSMEVYYDGDYYTLYFDDLGYERNGYNTYHPEEAEDCHLLDEIESDLKQQEDLAQYIEGPLSKKIKSITFNDFFNKDEEYLGYSYTIVANRQLSNQDIEQLYDYMEGQMADGFGEGYEQESFNGTLVIDGEWVTCENPNYDYDDEDSEEPENVDVFIQDEEADVEVYVHLWDRELWEKELFRPFIEQVN